MLDQAQLNTVIASLHNGGIIAYPTEAVFGLGCDPHNTQAIQRVIALKNRNPNKGLILIGSAWSQFADWVEMIPPENLEKVLASWPGPYTWVFPARKNISTLLTGKFATIAIRVTNHPIAQAICTALGSPIVSTSLNLENQPPIKTYDEAMRQFGDKVDLIVPGNIGNQQNPSRICDAMTGKVYRL